MKQLLGAFTPNSTAWPNTTLVEERSPTYKFAHNDNFTLIQCTILRNHSQVEEVISFECDPVRKRPLDRSRLTADIKAAAMIVCGINWY